MKYISFKSMAGIMVMASISLTAQASVPDESIEASKPFTITKVKYQGDDNVSEKTYSDGSWYNVKLTASGSTAAYYNTDYTYSGAG